MTKKHVSLLVVFVLLFTTLFSSFVFAADKEEWVVADEITINAKAHVQSFGDQTYEPGEGMIAFGTEGKAKRLENFNLKLEGAPADMELVAMAHVQSFGDMPATGFKAGEVGTKGLAKRIEGVAFKLVKKGTDTLYPGYRVGYAVHMQSFGWGISKDVNEVVSKNFKGADDFAFDGTFAGTKGLSKRIESVSLIIYKEAKLAVKDVSALNLKEIEVVFNKAVDVTQANFMINGSAVAEENFKLSEDKTTATLYNNITPVAGSKVKVAIINVDGLETTIKDVVVNDNALPAVESVTTVGNKLIKVNFTEPMFAGATSIANYKIGGYVKSGSITMSNFNRTANITLTNALADGSYEIEVNAANVRDFANNSIGINKTSFTIAKDAVIPTYTVLSATQQVVKIQFEREVNTVGADMRLYWKDGSTDRFASGEQSTVDKTVWTFTFADANRLPSGDVTLYIKKVVDFSGNVKENYEVKVSATVDLERPVYESYVQKDATTFEFTFSKPVVANPANYTFTDGKGVDATVSGATIKANSEGKVVVVTVSGLNTGRNPYTVKIKDVIDTTYLKNKASDIVLSLVVADNTAPTIPGNATRSGNTLSVVFSEDIDPATFALSNLKYSVNGGTSYLEIPTAAYVTFVGTRTINITFPAAFGPANGYSAASINRLYVADVKDIAGNKMIAVSVGVALGGSPFGANNGTAYMIDNKTILVEPANTLADIFADDFVVTTVTTGTTLDISKVELVIADTDVNKYAKQTVSNPLTGVANGEQLVKITLVDAVNANATKTVNGAPEAIRVSTVGQVQLTKDALDVPMTLTNLAVADKVLPTAPDTDKFTFSNADNKVNVSTAFITDETVKLEVVKQDGDVAAPTYATTADFTTSSFETIFASGTIHTYGSVTAGEEVYVRFKDVVGNVTAWKKLATKVAVAPTAQFTFDANGDGKADVSNDAVLSNVTDTMEYSLDGGSTWTVVPTAATSVDLTARIASITAANDIKVRVKENGTIPAGTIQKIDILAAPAAPVVVFTAGVTGHTTATGTTTAMEYSIDNGATWVDCTATSTDITATAGTTVLVRVTATAAATNNVAPAGAQLSHVLVTSEVGA